MREAWNRGKRAGGRGTERAGETKETHSTACLHVEGSISGDSSCRPVCLRRKKKRDITTFEGKLQATSSDRAGTANSLGKGRRTRSAPGTSPADKKPNRKQHHGGVLYLHTRGSLSPVVEPRTATLTGRSSRSFWGSPAIRTPRTTEAAAAAAAAAIEKHRTKQHRAAKNRRKRGAGGRRRRAEGRR